MTNWKKISELIIENTRWYVAANKPFGIPVQSDQTGDKSLQDLIETYSKKSLHLLNRLDRPVGGLVLFASPKAVSSFTKKEIEKSYYAIVEGKWTKEKQIIKHKIKHNKQKRKSFISEEDGTEAEMTVEKVFDFANYTALKVKLTSGKFHQIRALLAHEGFCIKGDIKYGAKRKNPDRSIHLFCFSMNLLDENQKPKTINCELPELDTLWTVLKSNIESK